MRKYFSVFVLAALILLSCSQTTRLKNEMCGAWGIDTVLINNDFWIFAHKPGSPWIVDTFLLNADTRLQYVEMIDKDVFDTLALSDKNMVGYLNFRIMSFNEDMSCSMPDIMNYDRFFSTWEIVGDSVKIISGSALMGTYKTFFYEQNGNKRLKMVRGTDNFTILAVLWTLTY